MWWCLSSSDRLLPDPVRRRGEKKRRVSASLTAIQSLEGGRREERGKHKEKKKEKKKKASLYLSSVYRPYRSRKGKGGSRKKRVS